MIVTCKPLVCKNESVSKIKTYHLTHNIKTCQFNDNLRIYFLAEYNLLLKATFHSNSRVSFK